jgi:disulfide bond formation protein DsbB
MAQMSKPVEVACDQPAWAWHGITMAAMNIPFSAALAVFALAATVKRDR